MINKVMISGEAKFDYEIVFVKGRLPAETLKRELEEYFSNAKRSERYVVLKYYDDENDKMLTLFLRKGCLFRTMQIWVLAGICLEEDYEEELDEKGLIKNWLDSFIGI